MKTKTFLLLCLFLGIGLTQLSAQNGTNGTGTVVYEWQAPEWWTFSIPIIWEGSQIDLLSTSGYTLKCEDHYKNGEYIWYKNHDNAVVFTSDYTGEVFTTRGLDYGNGSFTLGYCKWNLIGNNGSHYITHITGNPENIFEIYEVKTIVVKRGD